MRRRKIAGRNRPEPPVRKISMKTFLSGCPPRHRSGRNRSSGTHVWHRHACLCPCILQQETSTGKSACATRFLLRFRERRGDTEGRRGDVKVMRTGETNRSTAKPKGGPQAAFRSKECEIIPPLLPTASDPHQNWNRRFARHRGLQSLPEGGSSDWRQRPPA